MTDERISDERLGLPWHYQEASDAYTHIVRGPNDEFLCSGPQDSTGEAEARMRFIVNCANNYAALRASHAEALKKLDAMTEDRDLWRGDHDGDCPNAGASSELERIRAINAELVKALEIARMYAWPNATEEHRNIMDGTLEAARKMMG